ncbi:MAG: ATP-binding protein [Firmicutes bacterium]|nr:ATP-binding protein [Bacillota bacterium]
MKIAVLSGKGGTGKTLVSVNLAAIAKQAMYIDCDVEEPNGHLFFKPTDLSEKAVTTNVPLVDSKLCDGCKKCVEFCKFNALAYTAKNLIVFNEVCHFCGGCIIVCPQKALTAKERTIGKIQRGISRNVAVHTGIMNTGEASGIPIIEKLLTYGSSKQDKQIFIDCPPGSACIVMETIKDADYCILTAEPTIFGAHNLKMVYELVKLFKKPFGVVLNKCLDGENPSEDFCIEKDIKILCRIPFDNELGALNSNAEIAVWKSKRYHDLFSHLYEVVLKEAKRA